MDVFYIKRQEKIKLPIVLSIPHAGTYFPEDIQAEMKTGLLPPDDTDWFVDKLYDFANDLGILTISANYNRWVIDLNRNPDSTPLYNDGRVITELCTTTDFLGNTIYKDERNKITTDEINRRKKLYFTPYHNALQQLLNEVKQQFGSVLLWDCHSIRRHVPSIYKHPFPDLILGSADGTSASSHIIDLALQMLQKSRHSVSHNHPFKGGYITRHFGKPEHHQHALQLEMAKPLYMDDNERDFDEQRADKTRDLLGKTITSLGKSLS